jgi:EpsI family protein
MTPAVRVTVVSVCLFATAVGVASASRTERVPLRAPLAQLPLTLGEWQGAEGPPLDDKILAILKPDDYTIRSYRRTAPSDFVWLYIGYHGSQRQGDTIHSPLNCLPGAGWTPSSVGRAEIVAPGADGRERPLLVNRVVIEKGLDRQLVLYWYQSHGRVTASEYWGKFFTVVDAIKLARTDAALVRVIVPMREGDAAANDRAGASFIRALFPQLPRYLPS